MASSSAGLVGSISWRWLSAGSAGAERPGIDRVALRLNFATRSSSPASIRSALRLRAGFEVQPRQGGGAHVRRVRPGDRVMACWTMAACEQPARESECSFPEMDFAPPPLRHRYGTRMRAGMARRSARMAAGAGASAVSIDRGRDRKRWAYRHRCAGGPEKLAIAKAMCDHLIDYPPRLSASASRDLQCAVSMWSMTGRGELSIRR